jgi:RNA polymerase sigma-70 factor (ECF subfamily)
LLTYLFFRYSKTARHLTEQEIISGVLKANRAAQKALFDQYAGRMMALCNRYTTDRDQAQDFLQEGFIRVFKYIGQFRQEGSFEGWMRRIFVSVILRELSKQKMLFSDLELAVSQEPAIEPDAISRISEAELQGMIRSMPPGYRTVFNLFVIEGYSHEEIAELLQIQPATSRVQLMKARKYLQAQLVKKNNQIVYGQVV